MRPKKTDFDAPERCENCRDFIQHYIRNPNAPGGFSECGSGHCTQGRTRHTKPNFTCENFIPKQTQIEELP